jgi:esterase/lipase
MGNTKTVVFIHGLFLNSKCWDEWKKYFEAKGYNCHSPSYPFHEGDPVELRKKRNSELKKLTFRKVIESLASFIDSLYEKPIVIGHSMGGLAVQKLIYLDKAVAGIAINSAPPKGIFSFEWSFIKANFPIINPFRGNTLMLPSYGWWHYAFCNSMTKAESNIVYDDLTIPESRNIPRSILGKDGFIDFKKSHNPLLFIAGKKDHPIPSSLNKKNYNAYKDVNSEKEFKEFEGRTHYICGQKNWQEIADHIIRWLNDKKI